MINKKNDEGVSPVIGVILMVCVTVILAAVIASFVFGMAGQMQKTKVATPTLSRMGSNTVVATFQGGPDAPMLTAINWTVNGGAPIMQGDVEGTTSLTIGDSISLTAPRNSHIVGVGFFMDGVRQILIDTTI